MAGNFYKYIYKQHKGYSIRKNGIHYGYYEDIRDALFDRDRLIDCDWDIEEWVWLPERENPYKNIRLPPKELDRARQYVYKNTRGFSIKKKINGELKYFGTYPTLDEALSKRDELIKNRWET